MKVALYARVSKDEASREGKMQNPENQLKALRSYAEAMQWDIKKEFIEYASGGDANRPVFQSMMAQVRQRHFDLVLVWSLDRLSREGMMRTLSYIRQLKDYKTALKSLQESWLDTTQEGVGELLIAIFAWVAQEERKKISERTKAALARKKAEGVKLGRPRKRVALKSPEIKSEKQ